MNSRYIVSYMSGFLHDSANHLADWLNPKLQKISNNWWNDCVLGNLTPQQLYNIEQNKASKLDELDLAVLLHVTDDNWHLIKKDKSLMNSKTPMTRRMIGVRNTWAHIPARLPQKQQIINDAKVIEEFLRQLSADNGTINDIELFIDEIKKASNISYEPDNSHDNETNYPFAKRRQPKYQTFSKENDKRIMLPKPIETNVEYKLSIVDESTGERCEATKTKLIGRGASCLVYSGTIALHDNQSGSRKVIIKEFYPIEYAIKGVKRQGAELIIPKALDSEFNAAMQNFIDGQIKHVQFANENSNNALSPMFFSGEANNTYYVISALNNGTVLTEKVRKNYSIVEALELVISICEDLYAVHKGHHGIPNLYLDCKPNNLFVKEKSVKGKTVYDTHAYLFDFDSVQEYQKIRFCSRSAGWSAPEQEFNKDKTCYEDISKIGFQTDIFAIANLLVWLLVGKSALEIGLDNIQKGFDWKSNITLKDTTEALDDEYFIRELDGVLEDMLCFDANERAKVYGNVNAADLAARYVGFILKEATDATAKKRHEETIAHLTHIEETLDKTKSRIDNVSGQIDSVSGQIDDVSGRIDGVSGRIDGVSGQIDGVSGQIGGMSEKLDGVSEGLHQILAFVNEKEGENEPKDNSQDNRKETRSIWPFFISFARNHKILALSIPALIISCLIISVVLLNDTPSKNDDTQKVVSSTELATDYQPAEIKTSPNTLKFISTTSDDDYCVYNDWGDSEGGRQIFTSEDINQGVLNNNVIFNSVSDGKVGDERKFVGAKLSSNPEDEWTNDIMEVKDGESYFVCLYVHNDNPNGLETIAENTRVSFYLPTTVSTLHTIKGYLDSSNTTPSRFWDTVTLKSEDLFYLEYVDSSAKYTNNSMGTISLGNDTILKGGHPLGYDRFDGKIPGGDKYAGVVTIEVKVHKSVSSKLRVYSRIEGTKEWNDDKIDANIGDIVEYQIEYVNLLDEVIDNVMIRDMLPTNVEYIKDSTVLFNTSYPDGVGLLDNTIATTGINVGSYNPHGNAFVRFKAKVVDKTLLEGKNKLVNWASVTVYRDGFEPEKIEDAVIIQMNKKE